MVEVEGLCRRLFPLPVAEEIHLPAAGTHPQGAAEEEEIHLLRAHRFLSQVLGP